MEFLSEIDEKLFLFINHFPHGDIVDGILKTIHYLTRDGAIYYAIGIILLFASRVKYRNYVIAFGFVLIAVFAVNDLFLKTVFARPRPSFLDFPSMILVRPVPDSYSFPSGQAAAAAAFAATIFMYFKSRKTRVMVALFCFVVAVSRIYMGHHYPSDVFSGILIGTTLSLVFTWTLKRYLPLPRSAPAPAESSSA